MTVRLLEKYMEEFMEIDKKEYGKYVKQVTPVHDTWKNLRRAFLVGGLICMLGQVFTSVYMSFGIGKESAAAWTTLSLIGLSVILTGFHIYQKLVKFGGAGALVFCGIPGDRVQGGRSCLRNRMQDLYDRRSGDPLWDLCELGAGAGKIFLEVTV